MAPLFTLCVVLFSLLQHVFGQAPPYDPSPFSIIGTINGMTLDAGASPLLGGSITVDGLVIIVPANTIATLPATAVAWSELFSGTTANLPGSQSWQATVFGNRVGDRYIAGLIYIAQNPVQTLQGFITSINLATGHFTVAGSFATGSGSIDCVLNDPLGVYGRPYTANPLWSVDPVNPSIRASTGFPMCIPRGDPDSLCPKKNRPTDPATGRPSTQLTFKAPAQVGPNDPDPNVMAPLVVGDYVTFSGVEVGGLLAVNNLVANVGYYTAPGTKPAYVTCESANYGVRKPVTPDIPETRAVAFSTDPSVSLLWFALDVDPCTGVATERQISAINPSTAAPIGRAVYRLGTTNVSPPPRNVLFRLSSGTTQTANNLTAGQFVQPIFNYIFPESAVFGANLPQLEFGEMTFLAQGSGPFVPGNPLTPPIANSPKVGQLNPWPGSGAPTVAACNPANPPPNPAPPPGPQPKDTVTIVSATKTKTRGGQFQVDVVAKTTSLTAKLSLSVQGTNPLASTPMNDLGGGQFSLSVLVKGTPSGVTVSSSAGDSKTAPV